MARDTALQLARRIILPVTLLLIIFRSAIFIFWPQAHFHSDQAIFGLMAKHIAEGRASAHLTGTV